MRAATSTVVYVRTALTTPNCLLSTTRIASRSRSGYLWTCPPLVGRTSILSSRRCSFVICVTGDYRPVAASNNNNNNNNTIISIAIIIGFSIIYKFIAVCVQCMFSRF